jgi:hypothetical protein
VAGQHRAEVHSVTMGLKEDFSDLFEKISKLKGDPEKLRTAIAGVFLVIGFVMVKMPLTARLEGKHTELREAQLVADNADKLQRLEAGVKSFEHRLDFSASEADWQAYYYEVAEQSKLGITRFEDSNTKAIFDFQESRMTITAIGSYTQVVGFIDMLERGKRLVRLEDVRLSVNDGRLTLRCRLLGITRKFKEPNSVPDEGYGDDEPFEDAPQGDDVA